MSGKETLVKAEVQNADVSQNKSIQSSDISNYWKELQEEARQFDIAEEKKDANKLRSMSTDSNNEVFTAIFGSDLETIPKHSNEIEKIWEDHGWDAARDRAKEIRHEIEGNVGGSRKRCKTKKRRKTKKIRKTRKRCKFKKRFKTRKRRNPKKRRKTRKRRKIKKKLKQTIKRRKRGGDLPFCASFVSGGMDDVYATHGGILSGYKEADDDCLKKRGSNFKCNYANVAADSTQFQRRHVGAKGRLYFTGERKHKNLDTSCKLGQCCKTI